MIVTILSLLFLTTVVQVCHLLISLMALQKLLIYFFPAVEKPAIAVQKSLYNHITVVYIIFGIKELASGVWIFLSLFLDYSDDANFIFNAVYVVM